MANQPGSAAPRGFSEEVQLRGRARRRLVGAIALVALIVVILPMVLDAQPNPVGQDIAINIPSQQTTEPESKIAPIEGDAPAAAPRMGGDGQSAASAGSPAGAAPAQPPEPVKAAAVEPAKSQIAESVKQANVVEAPKTSRTDNAKITKTADAPKAAKEQPAKAAAEKHKEDKAHGGSKAADKGGFVVQLGVYSSAANVKQMQAKLSGRGVHTYTETLKTDSGSKIRLRAGPYVTRQEAEKARDKLKAAGENGIVVANK